MLANIKNSFASLLIVVLSTLSGCASEPTKPAPKPGKTLQIKSPETMTIEDVTNYHSAAGHANFLRDTVYQITDACIAAHGPLKDTLTTRRSDWEVINGPYTELASELDTRALQKLEQDGGLATAKAFRLEAATLLKTQVDKKIEQLQHQTGQLGYTDQFCIRMGKLMDSGNFNVNPKQFEFLYQ